MALSAVYVGQGQFPALAALLYGVKPVIIAIVLQALVHLASTALRRRATLCVGLCALTLGLLGVHELIVLALSGLALVLGLAWPRQPRVLGVAWLGGLPALAIAPASTATPFHLTTLFLAFLKIGATLFGSGYVLLAFMRAEFVLRLGWLSESQLLDAVAIGQVTPGPVFTTATFVGYLLGGPVGALVATVGIFLPAFVFVAASGPLIPRLRGSAHASAFLDGVNAASVALMALVSVPLARDALPDGPSLLLACTSTLLLLRYRVNSTWLVLAGAGLGGLRAWLA
jgi:chromate transporter